MKTLATTVADSTSDAARTAENLAQTSEGLAASARSAQEGAQRLLDSIGAVRDQAQQQTVSNQKAQAVVTESEKKVAHTLQLMDRIRSRVIDGASQITTLGERQNQIAAIVKTIGEIPSARSPNRRISSP
jgi:methyl-accepting chemotaxis protein